MKLSITTDVGEVVQVELARDASIQTLKAAIEAEIRAPAAQQALFFNGQELTDDSATISALGIQEFDVVLVRRRAGSAGDAPGSLPMPASLASGSSGQVMAPNPELLRQIAQNPAMLQQLQQSNPAMAQTIISMLRQYMGSMQQAPQPEDEFDLETQRRLEEEIRQENVNRQLTNAMEFAPETFGQVFMLYINCEVNGQRVKAFVDSGAQMTIMSSSFVQKCGLSNFIDTRWTGVAKGVGSAKIVGRVHMAQLKIETAFLPVSFTILEEKSIDLLLGLDMLRRHQCILDLKHNVLRIGDVATPFLSESEIPRSERLLSSDDQPVQPSTEASAAANVPSSSSVPASLTPAQKRPLEAASAPSMPQAPIAAPAPVAVTSQPPIQTSVFPEEIIRLLMDLGATRAQAIAALQAANGNADVAASLLF